MLLDHGIEVQNWIWHFCCLLNESVQKIFTYFAVPLCPSIRPFVCLHNRTKKNDKDIFMKFDTESDISIRLVLSNFISYLITVDTS